MIHVPNLLNNPDFHFKKRFQKHYLIITVQVTSMKILINAMNLDQRNGCGLYLRQLAHGLLKEDRENELDLAVPRKISWLRKQSKVDLDGLSGIVVPGGIGAGLLPSSVWHYRTLPSWEKDMEYDIFHDPNQIGCFIHDSPSAKILTIHDLSPLTHPGTHPRERVRKHADILPVILKNTDLVVVPSDATGNDVHKLLSVQRDRIRTVYPGCDHLKDVIPEEFSKIGKKMKILSDKPFMILAVSVLEPRKNIDILVDAFDMLCEKVKDPKDMYLVVVGECGWKYRSVLKRMRSSRFRNNIIKAGGVSDNVLVGLYRNSDVFVYVSQKEGFGFPPLEAQYFGLPAIISSDDALREVSGGGAVVIENDANRRKMTESLCGVLKEMRASRSYRKEFSEKGKSNARKYTTKRFAGSMLRVYREALS